MRSERGLGLVELLVAMTILGVTLGAGWRVMTTLLAHQSDLRVRLLAQWVAEDYLAELTARAQFPDLGNVEQSVQQGGERFILARQVLSTPNAGFRQVRLRVHDARQPERALTELVGFARLGG